MSKPKKKSPEAELREELEVMLDGWEMVLAAQESTNAQDHAHQMEVCIRQVREVLAGRRTGERK